jgi:hypothetical protein
MCWKSNLNELDTENIDDLGGKSVNQQTSSKHVLPQSAPAFKARPSSARAAAGVAAQVSHQKATAQPSPSKSVKNKADA